MVYRTPIETVPGLAVDIWEAIDAWAAIPATGENYEARVSAAAKVENVIAVAINLQNLINARMALDQLAHRLRDGGPETPRDKMRERVTQAAEWINEIVPRSALR